jgi:hypothetical protein
MNLVAKILLWWAAFLSLLMVVDNEIRNGCELIVFDAFRLRNSIFSVECGKKGRIAA